VCPPLRRGSIPYDKYIYRSCFADVYVHTYIQMIMWFSGTSTIYFIRPKYCALLVQSNTRKELLLRKRISALGSLNDPEWRRTRDTVSIDNRCRKSTSLNSYYESINSCEFEIFLLGIFRNFLATCNYFMILIWYRYVIIHIVTYLLRLCAILMIMWKFDGTIFTLWSNRENVWIANYAIFFIRKLIISINSIVSLTMLQLL